MNAAGRMRHDPDADGTATMGADRFKCAIVPRSDHDWIF